MADKRSVNLTKPEKEFIDRHIQEYIENNKSIEDLANDVGKPLDLVTEYCKSIFNSPENKPFNKLVKSQNGAFVMTPEASRIGDEFRGVNLINKLNELVGKGEGDSVQAHRLRELIKQKDPKLKKQHVHYIKSLEIET